MAAWVWVPSQGSNFKRSTWRFSLASGVWPFTHTCLYFSLFVSALKLIIIRVVGPAVFYKMVFSVLSGAPAQLNLQPSSNEQQQQQHPGGLLLPLPAAHIFQPISVQTDQFSEHPSPQQPEAGYTPPPAPDASQQQRALLSLLIPQEQQLQIHQSVPLQVPGTSCTNL